MNSSGSKGWHIRVLSPNECNAQTMRAFLMRGLIDCKNRFKNRNFSKTK